MREVDVVVKLASPAGGVKPRFTPYHVFMALRIIAEKGPIGRPSLMKDIGLGEASTKTLLRRMRSAGLIGIDSVAGAYITDSGLKLLKALSSVIKIAGEVSVEDVCRDCNGFGVVLRGGAKAIESFGGAIRARDEVVRQGGIGALILYVLSEGRFAMPTPTGLEEASSLSAVRDLRSIKDLREGDAAVIALCYKSDRECACYAVNSALMIMRN
ncbi:MAG: hypothetical protein B6U73_03355 [Desulfurococcales archaeon ex4484_204]|nr:MAG: hypothetical protein B6U73_03355 [Desulfurococcales archaeon ex4484_204]